MTKCLIIHLKIQETTLNGVSYLSLAPDCGREPSVEKTLCPLPTWGDEGGVSFISAGGFGEPEIL